MCRQIAKGSTTDLGHYRLEHITVLLDGLIGAAFEAVSEPVVNRVGDGVGRRSLDVRADVLVQSTRLVAELRLGMREDLPASALAVGGVAEDTAATQ